MEDKILESIAYILPAAVTGLVAYYMFTGFLNQKSKDKQLDVLALKKKEALPIKLQAYERMLLFCDRINPTKMVVRVAPITDNTNDYLQLLIANIEQELEHNFVQQLYVTETSWRTIIATKTTIIKNLQIIANESNSAKDLRENILIEYGKKTSISETATAVIKNEVAKLI